MKNSGFSMIEITIAIALIGIMASIGVPNFRRQLAIGKDTKAIATLGNLRTASELYFIETGTPLWSTKNENTDTADAFKKLEPYLDSKTFEDIKDGEIEIGGSRATDSNTSTASEDIVYGGTISFTFENPALSKSDGVYIWFSPEGGKEYDTKGNKWSEY